MKPQNIRLSKAILRALALALSIAGVCTAQSTPPDLTAPGGIAIAKLAMQRDFGDGNIKTQTFNLGPTGLRGWIHHETSDGSMVATGRISDASRQILVTHISSPGNSQFQVDDVILGAIAASSGTVPSFTSDARKALGAAITNAEKVGAGTLRLKRWRAGVETDVNITIPILGSYTATAPYNCPKSTAILASARNQMVGELLADPNYLTRYSGHANAIHALALLASVKPGDPNYSEVQTRLQTYARSLTIPAYQWAQDQETWIWHPAYELVFLSEYYLLTNDSQVVPTINGVALWLAEFQSMWGTFGHGPGGLLQDDSGRRFASGYGPVNAVGNIANLAMVLGKKALQTPGQAIDPKIDTAIQRAAGFLGSHVNKGCIQYGEHFPHPSSHASNGKDATAAIFFGLQDNYAVQADYFIRMATAGWIGVELGHCGQEFGTFWTSLGAGMGGDTAASESFKQMLWRYDIQRRTNGSFTYDSFYDDFYNGGWTADDTYLGESGNYDLKATAVYLLTYSLPLKRLCITGKQAKPAYALDAAKVANAISAGSFPIDRTSLSIPQLFTALGEYDPVVRYYASVELAAETLSGTDLTNLRGLLANPDPNIRQSAAETLGIRKDATALPTLVGMLNGPSRDPDHWVRQKVAAAIRNYDASTVSAHRDALINAFIANAPADPDVIDWADPLQFSNSTLSDVLFKQLADYTNNAPKTTHLYPALRAGLLLPTGAYRSPIAEFARTRLNLTDLQNLFPELVVAASADTPADRMFSAGTRANALAFMVENNISEGVEIAFAMFNDSNGFPWGSGTYTTVALNALVSYGDAARYTLPRLREVQSAWNLRLWDGGLPHAQLKNTITFLENVTSDPPATNLGNCVATHQIVTTTGAKAITLTGASPRGSFSFQKLTDPANGTLTGTAPNLTYTPNGGFTGTDKFTFQTTDSLTTSKPATVAIIVGSSGNGIAGAYFDNADFTSPALTRTDPQVNFDWGTGSPAPSIGPDTFSTRWGGYLLVPETGTYRLSSLTSDGVRAYINGDPLINNLNDQSTRWTDGQSISLTAGQKVPLLLEYYENTGSAVAKLKWSGPSFAGLNGSIIPQAYLFETNSNGGTDTTAPVILTRSPADGSTGVAHAADLVATFSENIVRGTGNITIKNVSDGTQTVIPVTDTAQVTISGATLIINPTALLVGSKNYAVQIDATAIDDTAGLSFVGIANDTNWNFTTTAPDTTKPTPNPMTFAVPPQTGGSTSITMTATTASDPSGVEYRFRNVTLGTDSPWQSSPVYTATGLTPSNNYTFTVQARDKSVAANTTTASAPASARTLGTGPLDLMSLNFYEYGEYSQNAVTLEAGESAGLGAFHVSGWQNYRISPGATVTLTSNVGSKATMRLNDVRNGGTHSEFPNILFAGGDGDLMNAQCHGTEDPYDQSALFNMDVSNIPYASYDLIVYLGTNSVHCGDRTGKIVLNGGAERDFTLTAGSFGGFTESTNATTPGNYIVFRGLTNPSLNLKVWGNGFNHLGPTGFQIVNYGAITGETIPPVISTLNPADDAIGASTGANLVATFSEAITKGTGNITVKNLTDATQTTIAVTDAQVTISGATLTINPTENLLVSKDYAIQIAATAIKDLATNSFAGITNDTTWNFTTSNFDAIPPPVTDGLALHLDATDPNTMTLSDSTVTEWRDKNGSAAKMTLATGTPTVVASGIGGIPTVHFTNGSSMGDGANHPAPVTIFYISRQTGGTNRRVLTGGNNWLLGYWNGSRNRAYFEGWVDGGGTSSDTVPHLYATTIPGSGQNSTVWAEGVQIASNQSGTVGPDGLFLGGGGAYSEYSDCDVSEVLVYHRVLTPVELNQVGFYLAQKYGVSATYVDPGPPVISTLNPADNVTGVAVSTNLVATFSEAIAKGTGDITVKNVTDGTQTTIAVTDAQVSVSGATLTINPTANLLAGKNYAIQIAATAIKDLANKSFVGITNDTTWNFATAAPDTTLPVISTYNPGDNATGVAVGANLVATFTESITIGTGDITLKNLTDATQTTIAVTDTTQVSISGSVLTINPTADLLAGKNYAIQIAATAIKDLANNAFVGISDDATWNFATEAALGSYQAGLWYGTVAGNINTTDANPKTSVAVDLSQTEDAIADNTTEIYTGLIYDADGQIAFTEDIDDKTRLYIDGILVLSSDGWNDRVSTGNLNLTPGWHEFELRISNGTGGSGPHTSPGFGYDPNGGTAWTHPSDPGDGSLFRSILAGGTALVVSSLNPVDNATSVAVTANLVATFSLPIARGTGNITIKNLTDGTQTITAVTDTAQVSISGAVLTINPTANLAAGKNYAIQIAATAIDDTAGTSFAGISDDTTWNFATVADTTVPTITNRNPADNSTGVAVGANLVATFSEPIVSGTGNITIRNLIASTNTNIAVTDTTQITISGSVLTINPTADLLPNTSYAVRIATTAIKDLAGNGFAGIANNTAWNFTTANTSPDTTAPTPNPMTFASPPTASDSTSITMTATTASDPSGVEYIFNNVTLATSSPWQNSAVYTATGLSPATSYTFTVQARDKSPAQNTTTASAPASATTQSAGSLDAMSLNFFAYPGNPADHDTVTLEAGESAGVGAYNVSGWQNYEVPWGLDSPASPFTLTSTLGATATMTLNDVRNGGTDNDQPNPNFGGSGDLMDGQANATEDPYDESAKFDMTVSNIPYPVYDLIVYLSGNGGVEGDGTGKLILNGGAVMNFTALLPFNGFVEITNATTPGNYVVFRKLRTSSLTLKVWGNGFNHIGPAGFQIVKDTSGILPPGPASNPNPPDTTVGHASGTDLSWTAGIDALSRNVYFGTNPSPGTSEFLGNQTATTFDPGNLANGTYYWRIDEVNADGTTTGPVWSFSVGPPAKAFRPMPWNGMKAVATNVGTLKWVAGKSALASSHDVYFGTNPSPGAAEFKGNQSDTTFNPGLLNPGTTYYWRVDQVNAQGTGTGDVWSFTTPGTSANKVKVFILAGQSNMVGQGEINPIGTPGTLAYTYNNDPVTYAHLKSGSNWAVRDDAWIWYNRDGTLVKGGHTVGYGVDANNIGPELQFGHAMGIRYGQKVLLIKAAWGGKSLQTDFRPPSAGWNFDVPGKAGDQGYYFTEMLKDVLDATVNLQTHFPAYNPADGFEFAGFAWHQGWNDLVSTAASAEYESNMEKFIKDLRLAVGVPNLPFVIATTGQSDPVSYSTLEQAQLAMENFTKYPAFDGNVAVIDAKPFWIPVSSSPADEGYHWNRNAKTYYMIGDALAGEMLDLQPDTTPPSPDPMGFATPPAALGQTSITMTAATATDPSGVEYFFECTAGGGHSSAWQDSPTYTDTGLTAATQYTYRVRARDKSVAQTATAWSAEASATTTNTPFGIWSGGATFNADANGDGVDNGMAWLLGAPDPAVNAAGKMPKATHNGTHLRLTFRCLKSTMRDGVVLKVQTSSDLGVSDPWTNHEAAVPDSDSTVNGVVFDTTDDGDYIQVIADIPAPGSGRFARLSAVVTAP